MAADEVADISHLGGVDGGDGRYNGNQEQPSMLSQEEQDSL